jgi:undecaprenyl-diphosphatase
MHAVDRTSLHRLEHFLVRALLGLAVVMVGVIVGAAVLVLAQSGWPPLERFDRGVAVALNHALAGKPMAATALTAITNLGGNAVIWWLATVTAAGMLLRRQVPLAVFLVLAGAGALALTPGIKLVVGWMRPYLANAELTAPGNGFPSGHAINATVFYGALVLVFLPAIPRRLRGLTIGLAITMVVLIGLTRAALGVHYISDVIAGWLLGLAWLAVTTLAFRRWRLEIGHTLLPVREGLEPGAANLAPTRVVPMAHPLRAVGVLVVAWAAIVGAMAGFGTLITRHAPGFDEGIPRWMAAHRTPQLDKFSFLWSQAGNTHAILAVGLVIAPLAIGCVHRWRPAIFLAVTMFGELALFLGIAALVGRPRPLVTQLDGYLPTSSFPSGHVAATTCLYGALAVMVVPRSRHWLRWIALSLAVLMPTLVALSRMYRGEHHPLDVTAGATLALLWLAATTFALQPNADLYEPPQLVTPPAFETPTGPATGPATVDEIAAPSTVTVSVPPTARSGTPT